MLRFIKHNLTTIDGIEVFPLISLLIFTIFFAIVIIQVIRMKKQEVNELSTLPFDPVNEEQNQIEENNSLTI